MKQIELELKKRLLIVEADNATVVGQYEADVNGRHIELICKGSELTEDIAKSFSIEVEALNPIDGTYSICYPLAGRVINATPKALESFISAIESKGYSWGENLVEKPTMEKYGWYTANSQEEESGWMYEEGEEKYYEALREYEEAESKTFNPKNTLIFEIQP